MKNRITKKQAKEMVKVLKKSRSIMQNGYIKEIDNELCLIIGNMYLICAIPLGECDTQLKGKFIKLEDLEVWCKLAKVSDFIDIDWIMEKATEVDEVDGVYPNIENILYISKENKENGYIGYDANLLIQSQKISGSDHIKLNSRGKRKPTEFTNKHNDIYGIVMPMNLE